MPYGLMNPVHSLIHTQLRLYTGYNMLCIMYRIIREKITNLIISEEYKFQHNILPRSILQLYAKNCSIHNHNHNTRSKDLLRISHGTRTFSNVSD